MHDQDTAKIEGQWRIDVPLLEHNLSLTYEERLFEHQQALNLFLEVQRVGRDYYVGLEQASQSALDE